MKQKTKRISLLLIGLTMVFPVFLGGLYLYNPFLIMEILLLGSPYKTQTILYQNKKDKNIIIEFQMQDIGALGYNRRVVKVEKGMFFNSAETIDTTKVDKSDWEKVDIDVNELGLKGG